MREAVIVSTARTGLAKSWRGALNMTHGATMGGHVARAAIERAGVEPGEVDDVVMGCATPEGVTGANIARQVALSAGCPVTVPGMTINRFCSSGLQAIALAAQRVMVGEIDICVAGGVEALSNVQNEINLYMMQDKHLKQSKPEIYWPMVQTAEIVAKRYNISRESQDRLGVQSQLRACAAAEAGKFKDEIVPITVRMAVADKATGQLGTREVTFADDEGRRADTTFEGVSKIRTAYPGGVIAAGNSSQFADGAGACVVMDAKLAEKRGLKPLGYFRDFVVAGCEPDEMGIGPVFAIPKLLARTGVKLEEIDLFELNEAFASQALYVCDKLGLDPEKVNVNGGAIALGHPLGCTGAKLTASIIHELRRRGGRYGIVSMCIGGGMGAAGLFEIPQKA